MDGARLTPFLSRRAFLARSGAALAGLAAASTSPISAPMANLRMANPARPQSRWFEQAWRRAVIDMHISDWDPKFLSEFDADQYVDALVRSRAQSIVCYAHSHVGLFNYPTTIGRQHAGLHGRDIVAEMIERCHRHQIAVVLYSSLIHDRWAFDHHPEWRGKHARGFEFGTHSRYGVVCPNSPYREYVRAWVREICERFDFEGMRFDMTFWVGVCYCDACQKRWHDEVGGEMPRTVDWTDEGWVRFQRKREQWLADFASIATSTVREFKPGATVEHQASTYPAGWSTGVSYPLVAQNDFLQGDFYGDAVQGSFVRKLLSELTPNRPFGYETSFSTELRDHTGKKSEPLLEAKASAAIADCAAFIFIDAIDPIGTVNLGVHDRMGRIFDRLQPFYRELGGDRIADIAVYYSLDSKFDMRENGRLVADLSGNDTHTPAVISAVRRLATYHLPFTVITAKQITELQRFKVLILSNVHHLAPSEAQAIREFVRRGGALYASGGTSLVTTSGRRQPDFQLADLFGVSLVKADWADREHYVSPTAAGAADLLEWNPKYPAFVEGCGFEVEAHPGAEVLATTTLPWPAPQPTQFSSIHSNPPWVPTGRPEVVFSRFGSGRVIYAASVIEEVDGLRESFIRLLRRIQPVYSFEAAAPGVVELTLFRQPSRKRYVLFLVNFQPEQPNIPVDEIEVRLRLPERISLIEEVPSGNKIPHRTDNEGVLFTAPRLHTLAMFAVKTEV
jgi:hypothetical protein